MVCPNSATRMANSADSDQTAPLDAGAFDWGSTQFAQAYICQIFRIKYGSALQKHAYSNILRILPPKIENVQMKNFNSGSFHIFCSKHRLWVLVKTSLA